MKKPMWYQNKLQFGTESAEPATWLWYTYPQASISWSESVFVQLRFLCTIVT
jgi:hypothetical protein